MSEKNEWKPIESAPKDGQSILGWGPCQDAVVIAWNEWAQPEPTWEAVGLEVNGFECPKIVLRGEPTLWQPLPDEPSKYAGDHDGMENEPMAIWAAEQREAAPAPSAPGDAQDERQAFETWGLAGCEMVDDPRSMRMDIARHCAWEAWQARARIGAPAAGDALAALRELVECDSLKKRIASMQVCVLETEDDVQELDAMMSDLARRQPAAWDAARAALAAQAPQQGEA